MSQLGRDVVMLKLGDEEKVGSVCARLLYYRGPHIQ